MIKTFNFNSQPAFAATAAETTNNTNKGGHITRVMWDNMNYSRCNCWTNAKAVSICKAVRDHFAFPFTLEIHAAGCRNPSITKICLSLQSYPPGFVSLHQYQHATDQTHLCGLPWTLCKVIPNRFANWNSFSTSPAVAPTVVHVVWKGILNSVMSLYDSIVLQQQLK